MGLEGYQLRAQLGAGPDGIAYQATATDGVTTVEVLDLSRARGRSDSLGEPRAPAAARLATRRIPSAKSILELGLEEESPLRGAGMDR